MSDVFSSDWYYLITDNGDGLAIEKFGSAFELADAIRNLPEGVNGFPLHGRRLYVTGGSWRYLVDGDKNYPLFDAPAMGKIDTSSTLGRKVEAVEEVNYKALMSTLQEGPSDVEIEADADSIDVEDEYDDEDEDELPE